MSSPDRLVGNRPQLLLVEDDAAVRRSLQLLLQARGFDVRAFASAAMLLAGAKPLEASCLIADYRLSDRDGIDLLARLQALGWSGPAILITAHAAPDLEARARAQGYDAIIEKPFREHVLAETLGALMTPVDRDAPVELRSFDARF